MFFSSKKKREKEEQERLEGERKAEEERVREEERRRELERLEKQRIEEERLAKLRRAQEEGSLYNVTVTKVIAKELKHVEMQGENDPFVVLKFGNDFMYQSPKIDDGGSKAEWNTIGLSNTLCFVVLYILPPFAIPTNLFVICPFLYDFTN